MTPGPEAESACYHVADYRLCPVDSSRRVNRSLCELCFPDGSVPDHVTHFAFSGDGTLLHRSPDQGGEAEGTDAQPSSSYSQTTSLLKREDVTTWEDARRAAGGDA